MKRTEDLAAALLGPHASDVTVAGLTSCLHHGNGAVRVGNDTNRCLVVLGDIREVKDPACPDFIPTVLSFAAPQVPGPGQLGGVKIATKLWRSIGEQHGLKDQRPPVGSPYKSWAPVATRTLARRGIGGPVGPVRHTTPDAADPNNTYQWFDLTDVPVGAVIWRAGKDGNVSAFQKLTGGPGSQWVKLGGRGTSARNYGDTNGLVAGFDFSGFMPDTSRPRPLVFDPASLPKPRPPRQRHAV